VTQSKLVKDILEQNQTETRHGLSLGTERKVFSCPVFWFKCHQKLFRQRALHTQVHKQQTISLKANDFQNITECHFSPAGYTILKHSQPTSVEENK